MSDALGDESIRCTVDLNSSGGALRSVGLDGSGGILRAAVHASCALCQPSGLSGHLRVAWPCDDLGVCLVTQAKLVLD